MLRIEEFVLSKPSQGNYFIHVVGIEKGHVLVPPCTRPRTEVLPAVKKLQYSSNTFNFRLPSDVKPDSLPQWEVKMYLNVVHPDLNAVIKLGLLAFPCAVGGMVTCSCFKVVHPNDLIGEVKVNFTYGDQLTTTIVSPFYTLPHIGTLSEEAGMYLFCNDSFRDFDQPNIVQLWRMSCIYL